MIQERRRHSRYGALNLLHFSAPSGDRPVVQGMGRTLNVSQAGLSLETHAPVAPGQSIALTVGLKEDLVVFEGRVIHCAQGPENAWVIGIALDAMPESSREAFQRYIAAFQQG
jgi:hypothetical protein